MPEYLLRSPMFWSICRKAVVVAMLILPWLSTAVRADNYIPIQGGGGEYFIRPGTLLDMRFKNVIKQRYDFSCGSAALATMLKYYYGLPVTEMDVLEAMYAVGNPDVIHKQGFSLLDMKNYLTTLGFRAEGFKEPLDKLMKVGVPAIVLINRKGYMHFVVISGVTKDKVLISDPAIGLRSYDRGEFMELWQNKILFVILNEMSIARRNFNTARMWGRKLHPDFQMAVGDADLARLSLSIMPSPNYY